MEKVKSSDGAIITCERSGSGPPLVLVHGSLNNAMTAWMLVKPLFEQNFTIYAIDRRGRRQTLETDGRTVQLEAEDVAAVVRYIGEPVFLFGHSYGAVCSLVAAEMAPRSIRRLALYEPPRGDLPDSEIGPLMELGEAGDWEGMVTKFITTVVRVPQQEFEMVKNSPMFQLLVDDAEASLSDFRAMQEFDFDSERYTSLPMPVQVLVGTANPRPEMYMTDALKSAISGVMVTELVGQAHIANVMDPTQLADKVTTFLLS